MKTKMIKNNEEDNFLWKVLIGYILKNTDIDVVNILHIGKWVISVRYSNDSKINITIKHVSDETI